MLNELSKKRPLINLVDFMELFFFKNKHKINKRTLNNENLVAAVFNSVAAVEEYENEKNVKLHKALVVDAAEICTHELTSPNSDQA